MKKTKGKESLKYKKEIKKIKTKMLKIKKYSNTIQLNRRQANFLKRNIGNVTRKNVTYGGNLKVFRAKFSSRKTNKNTK